MLRFPSSQWFKAVLASALSLSAGTSAWALPTGAGWSCIDHFLKEFAPGSAVKLSGGSAKKKELAQVLGQVSGHERAHSNLRSAAKAKVNAESKALSKLQERAATCRSISGFIDYEEMSQRCLGKKDWEVLNASQKQAFVSTLQALVEKRYYPRWRKIFSKGSVALLEETVQGKDILVRTRLKIGQKLTDLSWRVVDDGGCAKVVSLAVADRDLLEKLKGRIQAHRKKGDFQSLLAWMNGKVAPGSGGAVSKLSTVPTAAFAANNTSADVFTD